MGFFDDLKKTVSNAFSGAQTPANVSQDIAFADIPTTLEAMQALPYANMQNPYAVAAMCVCALNVYVADENTGIAMMNFLKGPDSLTQSDIQFIRARFRDNNTYKVRSYFHGATPDNEYMPSSPYTVTVSGTPYSRDNFADGYLQVFLHSGGADTPRPLMLRQKKSTGEWFVFSDSFRGLLADIRPPKSQNPWA